MYRAAITKQYLVVTIQSLCGICASDSSVDADFSRLNSGQHPFYLGNESLLMRSCG